MQQLPTTFLSFDGIKHVDADGEYWLARELAPILEYALWQNFERVVKKAMVACGNAGGLVSDHFIEFNKMVQLGSGSERYVTIA